MVEIPKAIEQIGLNALEISHLPEIQRTEILDTALEKAKQIQDGAKSRAEIFHRSPDGSSSTGYGASVQRERAYRQTKSLRGVR